MCISHGAMCIPHIYKKNEINLLYLQRIKPLNNKIMEVETADNKKIHQGRNAKRWRQVMGLTQEDIAALFENKNQQAISRMEDKEELNPEELEKIAQRLGITVEVLKNKEPQDVVDSIVNNFTISDSGQGTNNHRPIVYATYNNCTFTVSDEVKELQNKIKELEQGKNNK